MADHTALYRNAWEALRFAAEACKARVYGMNRCNPGTPGDRRHARSGGRWGTGLWTDADKAEVMAAGLRLTGYDVILDPGYSTGVIILDPPSKANYQHVAERDE